MANKHAKKMFQIIRHQGNANYTHNKKSGALGALSAGWAVDQKELLFIAGGNTKWYSYYGNSFAIYGKISVH